MSGVCATCAMHNACTARMPVVGIETEPLTGAGVRAMIGSVRRRESAGPHEVLPMASPLRVTAGLPFPLGASWDGSGVNVAVFSAHARARSSSACSTPTAAARPTASRCRSSPTRSRTATSPTCAPASSTACVPTAPTPRRPATASTPNSCCSTPTPGRSPADQSWHNSLYGYRIGSPRLDLAFDRRDSARAMPKCKVIDPAHTWGTRADPRAAAGRRPSSTRPTSAA